MQTKLLLAGAFAALANVALGANEYSDSDFVNNLDFVLKDNAPYWHFADGACYPQAAETNGAQTNGNEPGGDLCFIPNLPSGCQDPGPWTGANTHGTSFPTYYTANFCPDSNTWRLVYSVYFRHDSGHESDWEFAAVVLQKDAGGLWFRDCIYLEQDGSHPCVNYGDFVTVNDNDINDDSQHNGNHPKIYSAKYHHAMWNTQYTSNKNDCLVLNSDQFRVNDFYYAAADNLVNGTVIPLGWDWGSATSAPLVTAAWSGGGQNICNF
ncbi:hypothetical protein F5884DRAFT_749589 [Xylogone sp. PMI_703]|nr:hypothetical protein F5884DRAFT_749589 [Xylogone sp. PMI_703]